MRPSSHANVHASNMPRSLTQSMHLSGQNVLLKAEHGSGEGSHATILHDLKKLKQQGRYVLPPQYKLTIKSFGTRNKHGLQPQACSGRAQGWDLGGFLRVWVPRMCRKQNISATHSPHLRAEHACEYPVASMETTHILPPSSEVPAWIKNEYAELENCYRVGAQAIPPCTPWVSSSIVQHASSSPSHHST